MKKFFAVPLAVLFVAACSDSTAPVKSADVTPSYAKPVAPTTPDCTTNCAINDFYDFSGGIQSSSGITTVGTDVQFGSTSISASDANTVTSLSGETFLGRFANVETMVVINVPAGNANYNLSFDFYAIGSWDGRGKQAQNGVFQANVYDLGYRCSTTGPTTSLFKTTFSNQKTVQQDYPNAYMSGGFKAASGSYAQDSLGYKNDPSSNTPLFRSYGDVEYRMVSAGANPCGTGAVQFTVSTSAPQQQSVYDESWGVDNILVHAWN
jgi:hypothetical protein